MSSLIYEGLRIFLRPFFRCLFKAEAVGVENMPKEGGVILAANHLSNWDPPFLATYLDRYVSYMAKEELFKNPVFSWIITRCFAFPVKRGTADRGAIKKALGRLKDGMCLGVFPEGTRSKDGKLGKAEAGIGLIAAMAKVPVVPAAIIGTRSIFSEKNRFPKLKVIYGKPIMFTGKISDKEALNDFSQQIMTEIAALINLETNKKLDGKD